MDDVDASPKLPHDVIGTGTSSCVRPITSGRATTAETVKGMRRYLFIVSSRDPWLYCYLVERFSDDHRVDVIMDRRRGERRQGGVPVRPDRRHRDRRVRPEIDEELRSRSYAIVILSEDHGC